MEKMGRDGIQECHRESALLVQNECDRLPLDPQSIVMKDH